MTRVRLSCLAVLLLCALAPAAAHAASTWTPAASSPLPAAHRLSPGAGPGAATVTGPKGAIARTADGGATWHGLQLPTARAVVDVAWASQSAGVAIDTGAAVFRTEDGGLTWTPVTAGAPAPIAPDDRKPAPALGVAQGRVLLAGLKGMRRLEADGSLQPVGGARLQATGILGIDDQTQDGAVVAWGHQALRVTTDGGSSWRSLPLPDPFGAEAPFIAVTVDFTDARTGFVLDERGWLWRTRDAGRHWIQRFTGTSAEGQAWADAQHGWLVAESPFDPQEDTADLLRTDDGGRTWRPQPVAPGLVRDGGLLALPDRGALVVMLTEHTGGGWSGRLLRTADAGDAGTGTTLTLKPTKKRWRTRDYVRGGERIAVVGRLRGAEGGERVRIVHQEVGTIERGDSTVRVRRDGTFRATFRHLYNSQLFVAQWAGDATRRGAGSAVTGVSILPRRPYSDG